MRWFASLRRSSAFAKVRRRGRSAVFETVAAYATDRPGQPRVGVTVASAVGCAVVRNRVRRRVQGALEALSAGSGYVPLSGDFVFVARPPAAQAPYATLAGDVRKALARVAGPGR